MAAIDYAVAGPLTGLDNVSPSVLERIPSEAVDICRPVHSLVIQPGEADALGLPAERFSENQVRSVGNLIEALLALNPAPLDVPREPDRRVIGTCRHFAVLRARHRAPARRLQPTSTRKRQSWAENRVHGRHSAARNDQQDT
jgi:hypothetical protein